MRLATPIATFMAAASLSLSAGCIARYVWRHLEPKALPRLDPPVGTGSLSAGLCATCHAAIHAEWAASMMGAAFTDPAFQVEWEEQGRLFVCLNCHAPLEEQRPTLVSGLRRLKPVTPIETPNPSYDAALQQEGVTCVVCHLQDGALVGPHEVQAPHATRTDASFGGPDLCARCHQLDPPPFSNLRRPITDTLGEWERWKSATGRTESCVDCHMPAIERSLVAGGPVRPGRRHVWAGAWDDAMVAGAFEVGVDRRGSAVTVRIGNRAGHGLPSGEPSRAVQVEAVLFDRSGARIAVAEAWIARVVPPPGLREVSDNTLGPGETRIVELDLPAEALAAASAGRVRVVYHRLAGLPDAALAVPEDRRSVVVADIDISVEGVGVEPP